MHTAIGSMQTVLMELKEVVGTMARRRAGLMALDLVLCYTGFRRDLFIFRGPFVFGMHVSAHRSYLSPLDLIFSSINSIFDVVAWPILDQYLLRPNLSLLASIDITF